MKKDDVWGPPRDPKDPVSSPHTDENDPLEFMLIRRIELLGRLHHLTFGNVLKAGEQEGLPPAQMSALKQIIRRPGMSQQELADRLHVKRATTSVMLQKMEKHGYILRHPDPQDQRISRIFPTDVSIQKDEENRRRVDSYFAACFTGFSEEEKESLNQCLERLSTNVALIAEQIPVPFEE